MDFIRKAKELLGVKTEPGEQVVIPSIAEPNKDPSPDEVNLVAVLPNKPNMGNTLGSALYNALLGTPVTSKEALFSKIKTIEDNDYVKRMISDLANDVLYRGYDKSTDGEFFKISLTSDLLRERYLKDITNFIKSLNIYDYLQDMLTYIILRGERIIKIDYAKPEIDEIGDQARRITLFKRGEYVALLYVDNEIKTLDPTNYLPLRYKSYTYLTDVKDDSGTFFYAKLGDPLLSISTIDRLSKLKILENLVPLAELINLDRKMYFWYNVPPGTKVDEAFNQARKYENMLQSAMSFEVPNSVDDLLKQIGKIRVIPIFGEGKTIQKEEITKPDKVDQSQIESFKRSLAAVAGGFSYRVFGLEESETHVSPSYLRLVEKIRSGLAECIKQAIVLYCKKAGFIIDGDKVVVTYPKVPGFDEIEKMDFMQMFGDVMSSVGTVIDSASRALQEASNNPFVDVDSLINFYNNKLEKLMGVKPFKKSSKEELIPQETEEV